MDEDVQQSNSYCTDRLLPIANVGRIMKQVLPPTAKISKEAKQTMQECATEFINFVTCETSDKCHKENRKTVNGDDIVWALSSLGLDNYSDAILSYLQKYREAERERAELNKAASNSITSTNQDFDKVVLDGQESNKACHISTSTTRPNQLLHKLPHHSEGTTCTTSTTSFSINPLEFRVLEKGNCSSNSRR